MSVYKEPFLQSAPIPIEWAGWRSDTATLQRCGWKFAQTVDNSYDRISILLTHPQAKVMGIIERLDFEMGYHGAPVVKGTQMQVNTITNALYYHVEKIPLWREMDMEPNMVMREPQRILPDEIFRTLVPENIEVLVDRADMSVVEHLEAIKTLQAPKQFDLRKQARKEASRSTRQVVAQLVDYA